MNYEIKRTLTSEKYGSCKRTYRDTEIPSGSNFVERDCPHVII